MTPSPRPTADVLDISGPLAAAANQLLKAHFREARRIVQEDCKATRNGFNDTERLAE